MERSKKTSNMVMTAVMTAIIIIMANIPFLGYIELPFMPVKATIIHIPVIIGAIILGPKSGAWLGFVFGFTSFWRNTTVPGITSFVFSPLINIPGVAQRGIISCIGSLLICFLPRILIGITAYYVYKLLIELLKDNKMKLYISLFSAGIAGSLTNTLLVMNLIYFIFGKSYAAATSRAIAGLYYAILGIILTNGVPEAICAGILTALIARVLIRFKNE